MKLRRKAMIVSGAFDYVDVLNKAADYSWKRNEVINNNIANVDTPGYVREDVTFSEYLNIKMKAGVYDNNPKELERDVKKLANNPDGRLDYRTYKDYSGYSYRLDSNNVDIDTENVELASNQLLYSGIVDSMSAEFNRIKVAIGKG